MRRTNVPEKWFIVATVLLAGMAGSLAAGHAAAADSQIFLGKYGDWEAYQITEEGQKTCYIVSKPVNKTGKYKKRGDVVAFVTHRPKEHERDVVNFQAGYTYKRSNPVEVKIDGAAFPLITDRDAAWARNVAGDKAMVGAMIKGIRMVVKGTSKSGVTTVDTYSLKGFTAAHKRIDKACGYK